MAAPVPRLQLAGLVGDQRPVEIPQGASTAGSGGEGQLALQTPGRASTRTRARAILRAKARARRREEATNAESARATVEVETVVEEDNVDEEEEAQEEQACLTARASAHPQRCPPGHSARIFSKGHIVEDASSSSSSDDDSCSMEHVEATLHRGHFWEYPLSASEKQARLLMLFGRGEALSEKQIRRGERRMERLRAQVRLLHESEKQLKRERRTLCDEAAALRNENKDLRRQVSDLQRHLAKRAPDTTSLRPQTAQQSSSAPESTAVPAADTHLASAAVAEWSTSAMESSRMKPASSNDVPSPIPMRSPSPAGAASTPPPPVSAAVAAAAAGVTTPRVGATPRSHTARTPTGGMRGTIKFLTWAEAPDVPWMIFTSRVNGQHAVYGEGQVASQAEEHTFSLRRGEFIQRVMGIHSDGKGGALARSLKILTSEQQEVLSGRAAHSSGSPSPLEYGYFSYEAEHGHEIVGLCVQDGAICGVRQALLAPSRVQPNAGNSGSAFASNASFGTTPMSAASDVRALPPRPR